MDTHSFLSTAFLAVASCSLVHVGFTAFGFEQILDGVGHGLAEAFNAPTPHV